MTLKPHCCRHHIKVKLNDSFMAPATRKSLSTEEEFTPKDSLSNCDIIKQLARSKSSCNARMCNMKGVLLRARYKQDPRPEVVCLPVVPTGLPSGRSTKCPTNTGIPTELLIYQISDTTGISNSEKEVIIDNILTKMSNHNINL